ncbi:hypothetical protein [Streptomyces sp. RFCAC02]|nr:hypothetical protein [Streptomyces sp. RFCAC02]
MDRRITRAQVSHQLINTDLPGNQLGYQVQSAKRQHDQADHSRDD